MYQAAKAQDNMPWCDTCHLTWADFQGLPDSTSPFYATTSSLITYAWHSVKGGGIQGTVKCEFMRNKSWKKEGKLTDDLLKHEQVHFDIAEAYARELRKRIKQYIATHKFSPSSKDELAAINNSVQTEKLNCNTRYDEETEHSINKPKQEEWNKKVAAMLEELKEYASND